MHVVDAQRDVRQVYVGGFYGQLVSGCLWLLAAVACVTVALLPKSRGTRASSSPAA